MGLSVTDLFAFVRESNRIEGISHTEKGELDAHAKLLARDVVRVEDVEEFVWTVARAPLRREETMNVRVGSHHAPQGGPGIEKQLRALLGTIEHARAYEFHCAYETLHPFMDGNGRSGRALWLWQMERNAYKQQHAIGFLHSFYYQALQGWRKP